MDVDAPIDDGGMYARAQGRSCKANGRGCKQIKVSAPAPGGRRSGCITQFSPEEIVALQLSVQDMDKESQEMMILGVLSSCMRKGPKTECSKWKLQNDRVKSRSSYCLLMRPICKDAFLFLLGISQDKLTRLHKHYQEEGLTPPRRKKKCGRRNNKRALTFEDTARVTRFLKNFAEDHAVSLPGRVSGFKREDIRLLPSSHPKSRIYRLYAEHADQNGYRKVAKSTFGKLWTELCPYIVVARPTTYLCWRCQKNNTIYRSANLTMEEKGEMLLEQQRHLSQVDGERQLYRQMSSAAKATAQQRDFHQLQPTPANSGDFAMHYRFDYAQQVHYPSDAAQVGPLYFLTPRKCGIFGVHCEGLSKQVNFLIDEAVAVGKGSNAVISYLHFF